SAVLSAGLPIASSGYQQTALTEDLLMHCHFWSTRGRRRTIPCAFAVALAVAGCSAKTAPTMSAAPTPARATPGAAGASFARLPLRFEENRGQFDERVRFVARQGGFTLFLTDEGAVLSLREAAPASTRNRGARPQTAMPKRVELPKVLKLRVRDGQSAKLEDGERLVTSSNYFLGSDRTKWRTNVPNFREVAYASVRPGVDLVFHGSHAGRLEYDFVVAPGVAPDVELDFEGADSVRVADDGSLEIALAGAVLRQLPPTVYQTLGTVRQEVSGRYRS